MSAINHARWAKLFGTGRTKASRQKPLTGAQESRLSEIRLKAYRNPPVPLPNYGDALNMSRDGRMKIEAHATRIKTDPLLRPNDKRDALNLARLAWKLAPLGS